MMPTDHQQPDQDLDSSGLLTGAAAQLYDYWYSYLCRLMSAFYQEQLRAPSLISTASLQQCGYIDHFPNQTMRVQNDLQPGDGYYLTPSACLHLYPQLAGKQLAPDPNGYLIVAPCARFESGVVDPPFRRRSFTMLETVLFGEPDRLLQKRAELIEYVGMAFSKLGIKGSFETASDAFFLPEDAGAKLMQQLKGTKLEYQVHLGKKNVALASLNYHENHFTAAFSIGTETTHSMCVAFGIERLAAHSLSVWGSDQAYWPIC